MAYISLKRKPELIRVWQLIHRNKVFSMSALLVGVWILLLLPAVFFSQWFTLDIGGVFAYARSMNHSEAVAWAVSPNNRGGRYFPVYWLYNFAIFWLFPANIAANYLVQVVLFLVSLALTCRLFYKITDNLKATFIFGIAASLGGAVTENLYTLGKAEPLAYLFVISALVVFYTTQPKIQPRSALRFASISMLSALAIWSKETSLVLLVLCPVALVASIAINDEKSRGLGKNIYLARYLTFLASIIAGYLLSKVPSWFLSNGKGGGRYIDYKIDTKLISDNLHFYISQQSDVLFFGVAALILCGISILRFRSSRYEHSPKQRSDFIFVVAALIMAWSYYFGLLIWRWPMGYYLLLPSILFKFSALYALFFLYENKAFSTRILKIFCLSAFICIGYAIIHSFYVATSQLSYSRMYTQAVSKYLAVSTPKNRLVIESFPFYAEQVTNTKDLISVVSGKDRAVAGIADLLNPQVTTPEMVKLLGISQKQLDENESSLPKKGDYLLIMTGDKLGTWFVRGVAPYFSKDSILKGYGAYDMKLVAENKLFSPSFFLNIWTNRLSFGNTFFGYKLYQITNDRPKIFWKGRYPDGWIGKTASISLFPEFGKHILISVSTPDFNSPNQLNVTKDGVLIRSLILVQGKELTFEICNCGRTVPTTIRFSVERTAVPAKLKINKDTRELGVLIRAEPRL